MVGQVWSLEIRLKRIGELGLLLPQIEKSVNERRILNSHYTEIKEHYERLKQNPNDTDYMASELITSIDYLKRRTKATYSYKQYPEDKELLNRTIEKLEEIAKTCSYIISILPPQLPPNRKFPTKLLHKL